MNLIPLCVQIRTCDHREIILIPLPHYTGVLPVFRV